mgnify:CR=1 FL=1
MKITVDEKPRFFNLATEKGWIQMAGHEIKVGKYRFCATPTSKTIHVSEITTGTGVLSIEVDEFVKILTSTKEGTLRYFKNDIGRRLKKIIESVDIDKSIAEARKITSKSIGEMPKIDGMGVRI